MEMKSAIFDLDGTLVDSLFFWEWMYDDLAKTFCNGQKIILTPEDNKAFRTTLVKDVVVVLYEKYGVANSSEELAEYINKSIQDFYKNRVMPKAGVIEFLEHLKATGVKMCIASATAMNELEIAVKSCGLDKYIDKLFSCSELGFGKEKPDVFLNAAEYLGADISQTWVFEDSLLALTTARKAGFKTVGIFDKNNPYTVEQLKAVSDIFIGENDTLAKLVK